MCEVRVEESGQPVDDAPKHLGFPDAASPTRLSARERAALPLTVCDLLRGVSSCRGRVSYGSSLTVA